MALIVNFATFLNKKFCKIVKQIEKKKYIEEMASNSKCFKCILYWKRYTLMGKCEKLELHPK